MTDDTETPGGPPETDRRSFSLASIAMAGGLAASYGTLGYVGFRFLEPQGRSRRGWMLVKPIGEIAVGDTIRFRTPAGATVNITRRSQGGSVEDFKALSSVCPHLGCQVHWEAQNNRYFCPCHNGVFDPDGKGIGGPPADAGQTLSSFNLEIKEGLLYIEVPLDSLAMGNGEGPGPSGCASSGCGSSGGERGEILEEDGTPRGPGHDPCLGPRDGKGRPA